MKAVLFAIGFLAFAGMGDAAGAGQMPNLIYFLADDLGWGDVGFHCSDIRTPAIDQLASIGREAGGPLCAPVCSPTRAALLTGRYPIRYGLQTDVIRPWASHGLPVNERTLAEVLRAAGYRTALLGKWHLGDAACEYLPQRRGFEYHYGHYNGAINYLTHDRDGSLD